MRRWLGGDVYVLLAGEASVRKRGIGQGSSR